MVRYRVPTCRRPYGKLVDATVYPVQINNNVHFFGLSDLSRHLNFVGGEGDCESLSTPLFQNLSTSN